MGSRFPRPVPSILTIRIIRRALVMASARLERWALRRQTEPLPSGAGSLGSLVPTGEDKEREED